MGERARWITLALLAGFFVLVLMRAGSEASLWTDEIYSLQVSELPARQIVAVAAGDFHPPGYYLALAGWRWLGERVGPPVSPLWWARSLNALFWLLAVASAAVVGVRRFGRGSGLVPALLVAGSAAFATQTQDLRSYGPVAALFVVACCCLLDLEWTERTPRGGRWLPLGGLWLAVGLSLWLHVLAWLLLAVLLPASVVGDVRERHGEGWPGRGLPARVAALFGAALIGLPWLRPVLNQAGAFAQADTSWMTEPTVGNLLLSFWYWPLGSRLGDPLHPDNLVWTALIATAGLLTAVELARRLLRGRREESLFSASWMLLGGALTFVAITWALGRWSSLSLYHGPRYQLLVAPAVLLVLGVVLQESGGALARSAIVGLLVAGATSQLVLLERESLGPSRVEPLVAELESRATERVAVVPASLAPFHRHGLRDVEADAGLREICTESGRTGVLVLTDWTEVTTGSDRILLTLLRRGDLPVESEHSVAPNGDGHRLVVLAERGGAPPPACRRALEVSAGTDGAVRASPENQVGRGWSYLEIADDGGSFIWATEERVTIRLDRAVPAGKVRLRLHGYSSAPPADPVELHLEIGPEEVVRQVAGGFEIVADLELERELRHVTVGHPVRELGGRRLSFSFLELVVEDLALEEGATSMGGGIASGQGGAPRGRVPGLEAVGEESGVENGDGSRLDDAVQVVER